MTSWLRVVGKRDDASCSWCSTWVDRVIPVEMRDEFLGGHKAEQGDQACRCELVPEETHFEAEDPSCLWA